ncbi:MAG TPA: hypothetical protein VF808_19315 [Ktedonobacterales bacterium]
MEKQPVFAELRARRLSAWRQTAERRIAGPDEGAELIETLGLVTLYPVTPETPDLYHAYVGDPDRPTDSKWDSPSGQVYTWRWILGRRESACYTIVVKKRPTWIAWDLLPAVLRLLSDPRMPDELLHLGVISPDAFRVAHALEEAERPLSTSELREAARFPTGKDQRAAYQKALAELDARLLLTRVFSSDARAASDPAPAAGETAGEGEMVGMGHTLFSVSYRAQVDAAERLTREQALDQALSRYLPGAVWATTRPLSRALGIPQPELDAALSRLELQRKTRPLALKEIAGPAWLWVGE